MFQSERRSALAALDAFLPHAGRDYATGRNTDPGPKQAGKVSQLSPWIRVRLLTEWETLSKVLELHTEEAASKFIDEVCWRTYWKGWLEMRPSIWSNYLDDRSELLKSHEKHIDYLTAVEGRTGIDCFDAWNEELKEANSLHNHARMWYASIWIHTLKLPWQLGADWFLRHLLDGDPASNTLSWRWVAGLHTKGKAYLARPENIRKYTNNRFEVGHALASEPIELAEHTQPKPRTFETLKTVPEGLRLGLLVTDDDLNAANWIATSHNVEKTVGLFSEAACKEHHIDERVIEFRRAALSESVEDGLLDTACTVIDWVNDNELDGIITPALVEGYNRSTLRAIREELEKTGKHFCTARHWWDETLYPHATHGFFRFKQAIPRALAQLKQPDLFTTYS